jgi:hypothetical protein
MTKRLLDARRRDGMSERMQLGAEEALTRNLDVGATEKERSLTVEGGTTVR